MAYRAGPRAVSGRNVASARRRLASSNALATAVARGDRSATRAALMPLLRGQIHRIIVRRGGRVLAELGTAPALAPVHGVIRLAGRSVGSYTLSVAEQSAIASVIRSTTGARVAVVGGCPPAGTRGRSRRSGSPAAGCASR